MQATVTNQTSLKGHRDNRLPKGNMKLTKKVSAARKGKFIAIGPKGTAYVIGTLPEGLDIEKPLALPWASYKETGVRPAQLCNMHAAGKPAGGRNVCYDVGCYVAQRGQAFRIVPESAAVKAGLKLVAVKATQGKVSKTVTVYVPSKFNPKADKLPHYLATAGVPAGRIETSAISKGENEKTSRNASLKWSVSVK